MMNIFLKTTKLFLIFLITTLLITNLYAQGKKKVVDVKGNKVEKARGENPNIKFDVPTTDDKPVPKPEKARGEYCSVIFDNYTGYYVKIFIDGNYKGTLAPWDKGSSTVYSGYTTIYCITTGGTRDWAATGNCEGTYTYKLE